MASALLAGTFSGMMIFDTSLTTSWWALAGFEK
jgi:hypothetical protein